MFYGTDIQNLQERLTKLEDKVTWLDSKLKTTERNIRSDNSSRNITLLESITRAVTIKRDGEELRIREVLEALLDYHDLDVKEVKRHLELIERDNYAE